jgi:hypothetical protein
MARLWVSVVQTGSLCCSVCSQENEWETFSCPAPFLPKQALCVPILGTLLSLIMIYLPQKTVHEYWHEPFCYSADLTSLQAAFCIHECIFPCKISHFLRVRATKCYHGKEVLSHSAKCLCPRTLQRNRQQMSRNPNSVWVLQFLRICSRLSLRLLSSAIWHCEVRWQSNNISVVF